MTQHFSAPQLRAARGLLDWTRAKLAELSGVSEPTLHRIETGAVQPHEKSIAKIIRAFEENGVEFTDDGGVRPKHASVEIFTGTPGQQAFFNNVYAHVKAHGGTVVQIGIDERRIVEASGIDYARAYNRWMVELVKERKDIKVLAIVQEGDTYLAFSDYNEYRWISQDIFAPVPFYIYGDNLAIFDYQTVPSPTIIVHKSSAVAKAYRKQFEVFWKISRKPDSSQFSKSLQAGPSKAVKKK